MTEAHMEDFLYLAACSTLCWSLSVFDIVLVVELLMLLMTSVVICVIADDVTVNLHRTVSDDQAFFKSGHLNEIIKLDLFYTSILRVISFKINSFQVSTPLKNTKRKRNSQKPMFTSFQASILLQPWMARLLIISNELSPNMLLTIFLLLCVWDIINVGRKQPLHFSGLFVVCGWSSDITWY